MTVNNEITVAPTAGTGRQYDVDWLRTIALGLLIVYHIVICFQPWAEWIKFPQNEDLLEVLWIPMAMLNIWRIPLLFMISGMGVFFAMERRNWKQLLLDRTVRILLPLVFGSFALCPVLAYYWQRYSGEAVRYVPTTGHLWFLTNIFCYVLWLLALFVYLKAEPDNVFSRFLKRIMGWPCGLFLFALPFVLEAVLVRPKYYSLYVDTLHGWLLGLLCFFLGFVFVSAGEVFRTAVRKARWIAVGLALPLYLVRLFIFRLEDVVAALTALESVCWMLAVIGFASVHLNKASRLLGYLSKAVYPVYIFHLPIQFALAYYLLPLEMGAMAKLLLLTVGTFGISLVLFEIVRHLKWIRPLFGVKW